MVGDSKSMKAVVIKGDGSVVSTVPIPPLPKDQMRIRTKAVAINPTDWKHIVSKIGPQGSILGCDVAGEVVELGADVEGFKIGDSIYCTIHGASVKHPENGAYAEYVIVDPKLSLKVPGNERLSDKDTVPEGAVRSVEAGASIAVALATAGMVLVKRLGLKCEWQPQQVQNDKPLVIWGGATAVGLILIQLAKKMKGYSKIIVVASRKHDKYLKSLGADDLYDYHDEDVIEQIKSKYKDLPFLVDAVSTPATFRAVYKLANADKPAKVVQLMNLTEEAIPKEERKPQVTVEGEFLYLITGQEVTFGSFTLPASPEYRETAIEFLKFIGPKVADGEIRHIPLKIFHNGLEDVPGAIQKVQRGENSCVKYVVALD